jgi:riboflavin kinase/FMN adenylyltransferase
MRIIRDLASYAPEATAVALGTFDGVHLAHQAILRTAVTAARAAGLPAVACTFDPPPRQVLQPDRAPAPLTTLDERLDQMATTGLDVTVVMAFTASLASVEAEAFVEDVLVGTLRAREVVVGFNHTFGRGARGDPRLLHDLGRRLGFRTHVVEPLRVEGIAVSSSAIRSALSEGRVELASRMLGRPYSFGGEVVAGAGRGRTLGFPTANVEPDRPVPLAGGVYACRVEVDGTSHPAVVNVGVRPTFGEASLVIEAHLLDFQGSLYGRKVRTVLVSRLRGERRFPSVEALREQIGQDVAAARERLGKAGFTPG